MEETAPRRSARPIKRPELLTYEHKESPQKNKQRTDTIEEADDIDGATDSSPVSSAADHRRQRRKPPADNARPKHRVVNKAVEMSSGRWSQLFVMVEGGRDLHQAVNEWITSYRGDKVAAVVRIINFVLACAGVKRAWIAEDVDLEALEPDEIDVMLDGMLKSMSASDGSSVYPLNDNKKKAKAANNFRAKFQHFWAVWVERVRAIPSNSVRNAQQQLSFEIIRTIIEQLVSFSSMSLVNIRDAVTEALLSIASALVAHCRALKQEVATAERQILADTLKKNKSSARDNPKSVAVQKLKDASAQDLDAIYGLVTGIFNSVYVHRSKDYHEDVRTVCVDHLLDFVLFDVRKSIRADYVKYLGWACSDYSNSVRLAAVEAIDSLVQGQGDADNDVIKVLSSFVEHFIDRFVEMAAGDVDDRVALATICCLRSMQRSGLLDSISEEKLDLVDVIVFDPKASNKMRQEALAFMMDHTEGFDEENEEQQDLVTAASNLHLADRSGGRKKSAKKANRSDELKALARRQKTAIQLETLTEFAQYHLHDPQQWSCSVMLAEACVAMKQFHIMYDWSTIIALIMKEEFSDSSANSHEIDAMVVSTDLKPAQISILLRMFVACAIDLFNKRRIIHAQHQRDGGDAIGEQISGHAFSFATQMFGLLASEEYLLDKWTVLNETLLEHLPTILKRFQHDEPNLTVAMQLLECCDYNSVDTKAMKSLLDTVMSLLDLNAGSNNVIVNALVSALRKWTFLSGTAVGFVKQAISAQLSRCWTMIGSSLHSVKIINSGSTASVSTKSRSKTSRERSSAKKKHQESEEESFLLLNKMLLHFKMFWTQMDCRQYLQMGVDSIVDDLVEIIDIIPTIAEKLQFQQFKDFEMLCSCAVNAVKCINCIMLWTYKDVLDIGKKVGGTELDVVTIQERVDEAVDSVVNIRTKLVDGMQTWMSLPQLDDKDDDASLRITVDALLKQQLQLEGFRTLSEVRSFFPARVRDYKQVERLAYAPSAEVLSQMRMVFESQGERLKEKMLQTSAAPETDEVQNGSTASRELVDFLLFPLSRSLVFDLRNLNRRQAAAVVCYLLDPNEDIQEAVKCVTRRIKELDIVKYLEIQIVALKGVYGEYVHRYLQERIEASAGNDLQDDTFDFQSNRIALKDGFEKFDALAKRLAQSLGIAKLRDTGLGALVNMFKSSIDIALSDISYLGFISCLMPYLRLLPPSAVKDIVVYFTEHLQGSIGINTELAVQKATNEPDEEFVRLLSFIDQIHGRGRPKMTRKRLSEQTHAETSSLQYSYDIKDQKQPPKKARVQKESKRYQLNLNTSLNNRDSMGKRSAERSHDDRQMNKRQRSEQLNEKLSLRRSSRATSSMVTYAEIESDEDEEDETGGTKVDESVKGASDHFAMGLDIEDIASNDQASQDSSSRGSTYGRSSSDAAANTFSGPSSSRDMDIATIPSRRRLLR